jgi:hypothetical protein
MKEDAQLWHDLLWCSGGKLELSKCGYHVIYYDSDDIGIPRMRHSPDESITLKNDQGDLIPIQSESIYKTRINLGHAKAPGDSCRTEFDQTMKKAVSIGDVIAQCRGTRSENKMLYRSVWKPAVQYKLQQPLLSENQLKQSNKHVCPNSMQNAVLIETLHKSSAYVTAGTCYVTYFLKNWRTPTEDIGKQLRIVYAWYAYQSGVSSPILEHPERKLDYISGRVIQGIGKYLDKIDCKIVLHNTYIRTKLRVNDKCIMERVTELEFTQNLRKRINCVIMYLGVMYLSEICNMSGSELQAGIENSTLDKDVYNVTMQKPKQKKPNS